jgi:RNA polymerase sigma-70 factor (ECF subfamily)
VDRTGPTDSELIERARGGDEAAFADLCARYETLLTARIRPWLGPAVRRKVSILDVLQETWVTAHHRLPDFENRGEGAVGAWLARIAELKAREAVRRYAGTDKRNVKLEVTRGRRIETERVPGRDASPSKHAAADERQDQIRAAMERLPADYARVLRLLQIEQVPLDAAAHLMGRSRDAVKKLYSRALARLADLIDLEEERHG